MRGRMVLVAPQGFEPRLDESESSVLPLNEGAIMQGMVPLCGSAKGVRRLPLWSVAGVLCGVKLAGLRAWR